MVWPCSDYYDYLPRMPFVHSHEFFTVYAHPWVYPAPAILLYYPFNLLSKPTHWHPGYLVFAGTVLGLTLLAGSRLFMALRLLGLAAGPALLFLLSTALFSWPLYFSLQRGNIEALAWLGVAAGVFCVATGRLWAGSLLLGFMGSVKLYPLLFLALLFRRGRFGFFGLGLLTACSVTLFSLWLLDPAIGHAWTETQTGIRSWTAVMSGWYGPQGVGTDHSCFALLRQLTFGKVLVYKNALSWCLGCTGVLAGTLYLFRMRGLPTTNQIVYLGCVSILLPPASFDYTVSLMLIPFAALTLACVQEAERDQDQTLFFVTFSLLAVILAPLTFFHTHGAPELYFEGSVRCVALLVLATVAALTPIGGRNAVLSLSPKLSQQRFAPRLGTELS